VTPGRLLDHLQSPLPPQYAAYPSVASWFAALKTIVYDEAEQLLDQAFKRELEAIIGHLLDKGKVPRQAMVFSATTSKYIQEVCSYFF
jgi:superfamily II DNA/RNA helicase